MRAASLAPVFSALLDANVLVPSLLRDVLLQLAVEHAYRPLWSDEILAEVEDAVVEIQRKKRANLDEGALRARLRQEFADYSEALPDALVTGWHSLTVGMLTPDPDDRHVVAAAVAGRADTIVTNDVDDFPEWSLPFKITAQTADQFLADMLDMNPLATRAAVDAVASRTSRRPGRPELSPQDVVARLGTRSGCPTFAAEYAVSSSTGEP